MKPLIECVRDFILTFPDLDENGCLYVDYLGDQAIEYSVETVPCDPVFKRYTDGGCMKQFLFLFASREYYSADVIQCIENLSFYEDFSSWINQKNRSGELPDLDGRDPVSIEVLTGGYAFDADAETARYQIQLRLLYEED
ncbi:MAG: chloramphenicol resistance protein [Oscillospiraceae bacterium]|nr:chloramphenicol resistance protein [Oscillospiraceae bacterium]